MDDVEFEGDWHELATTRLTIGRTVDGDDVQGLGPPREVSIGSLRVLSQPVSIAQFRLFADATGYVTTAEHEGTGFSTLAEGTLITDATWRSVDAAASAPVTQLSWFDCFAFCQWSNTSMLTEAEWEYTQHELDVPPELWEWCADWFDLEFHRTEQRVNPTGPTSGMHRLARRNGGALVRQGLLPDQSGLDLTFRVATRKPRSGPQRSSIVNPMNETAT